MGEPEVRPAREVSVRRSECNRVLITLPHQNVYVEASDAEKVLALLPDAIRQIKEQQIDEARRELNRARAKLRSLGEEC